MKFKNTIILSVLLFGLFGCACQDNKSKEEPTPEPPVPVVSEIDTYVTKADKSMLFQKVELNFNKEQNMSPNTVKLLPETKYQTLEGFGAAITWSTAYNLMQMSAENRTALLKECFDTKDGMGMSYIRISIGCSDFSSTEFTCEDTKGDWKLHNDDTQYVIPVIKEILSINPKVKIMGSPWTAPQWMKVADLTSKKPHNSWKSGHLNPDYYDYYAYYFVRWIKEMANNGIVIDAITIQNEPLNHGNSASMYMGWEEQRNFIKTALGPTFVAEGIKSKIVVFDHNFNYDNVADQQSYPTKIYADAEAAKYIDGAAYHAYGGNVSEMGRINTARPDKNLYFTEMSIGTWGDGFAGDLMWNMKDVFVGSVNNFSKNVVVWNLVLDDKRGPNRPDGGCQTCYGCIDINSSDYKTLNRQSHYYNIVHMSKVIDQNAVRIGTSGYTASGLSYTAAQNPDGSYGVVAVNDGTTVLNVTFALGTKSFTYNIPAKGIVSFKFE